MLNQLSNYFPLQYKKHDQNINMVIKTHKNSPPTCRIRAACAVSPSGQLTKAKKLSINLLSLPFYDKMMKFCCTLPNFKRCFPTQRGLFQHEIKDPLHNPKIYYSDSRLNCNNKRGPCDSSTLPYEQGYSESNYAI